MVHTDYAWYVVGILVISGFILFALDRKLAGAGDRQKERTIVRSFGWVHLAISIVGLAVLLIYIFTV